MGVKLPFPRWMQRTHAEVCFEAAGLDEDGAPKTAGLWAGPAVFNEESRVVNSTDGRLVRLAGQLVAEGDMAPGLAAISGGKVAVAGGRYAIFAAKRPRNPDGSVHHTLLELI